MFIAAVIVICIVLAVLAFVFPRLSSKPQSGVSRAFHGGGEVAGKAPGKLGKWLRKPFDNSAKAANRSAGKGRSARSKLPA